jgi:hypothetical protein
MAAMPARHYSSRLTSLVNIELAGGVKKPIANPIRVTIQETFVARHGKICLRFRESQCRVLEP